MSGETRENSSPLQVFAQKTEALRFLQARGFKIGRTKFGSDCKSDLVQATPEGELTSAALLAYAREHLAPAERAPEPQPSGQLALGLENTELSESATASQAGKFFRKRAVALEFLQGRGFKISRTRFYADCKSGLIQTTPEGHFPEWALMAYAGKHLEPLERVFESQISDASRERLEADAALKSVQAERFRLKLSQEQGQLIEREAYERDLAARAQLFKTELLNFGQLAAPKIIAILGGDENKTPDFLRLWDAEVEQFLDAFAQDRVFVIAPNPQPQP